MSRNLVVALFIATAVLTIIAGCAAPECCRLTPMDRETLRDWAPALLIVDPVAGRVGVSPEFGAEQRAIDKGAR